MKAASLFARSPIAAAVAVAIATGLAPCAYAQNTDSASDGGIPDVIVTATRQQTNLQSTPIAITAISADALAERSITNTADLGSIVPNATFREAQGAFGKGVTAFIRGIGQGDTNLASEPGVAYYIDDVYWFYQGSIVYSAVSKTYNQPGYGVFNGRVTYENDDHDVSLALGATNLTNKGYWRNFFIYQELGYPNVEAQPAPPREWFLTLRKKF